MRYYKRNDFFDEAGEYSDTIDADYTIYYFDDYTGNVEIVNETTEERITVPFRVLKAFVGQAMQAEAIARIRQSNPQEFLEKNI